MLIVEFIVERRNGQKNPGFIEEECDSPVLKIQNCNKHIQALFEELAVLIL